MALTGRRLSASEAKEWGLVNAVIPGSSEDLLKEALKVAETIASHSPDSIIVTREGLKIGWEGVGAEEGTQIWADTWYSKMNGGENMKEGICAMIGARIPHSFRSRGIPVPGIAPETTFNGTNVNLLRYFDAALLLVTHVWQYFGVLLNCSKQGIDPDFPAYKGNPSMYEVHKYMDLDPYEQGWFVDQLTQAAASIGFSAEDTTIWFNTMTGLFSSRCSPPTVVGGLPPALNAICTHSSCPVAEGGDCALYNGGKEAVAPGVANVTLAGNYTKMNGTAVAGNSSGGVMPTTAVQSGSVGNFGYNSILGSVVILIIGGIMV
ncbi:putative enoyl-CoA hydratase, mitochondrial [Glarea lozoyensis 74030]|uniref:Putative enoyl-CoA hydratase, mitochondrial n=1 Tax=Glarea lozoyensis (strain ATCC 74030 / MF5533) TaxID=1104152 RepID=H0EY69_GLAL7|nr:putative enoyl-CoA hydratase, mitochondrial [Glarea lozoyensis 74030]